VYFDHDGSVESHGQGIDCIGCDFGMLNSVFSKKLVECWISYINNLLVIFTVNI